MLSTVEPEYNKPLHNKAFGVTNDILCTSPLTLLYNKVPLKFIIVCRISKNDHFYLQIAFW